MNETPTPLRIWTIAEARAGIENQVTGLAEAIQQMIPAEITKITLPRPKLLHRWIKPKALANVHEPWPDIILGCGRASLAIFPDLRKQTKEKSLWVQLQNPRRALDQFDLVIAPKHDEISGENVFGITGAPGRITPENIHTAHTNFAKQIQALPTPRLAVLLGGTSKRHTLSKQRLDQLLEDLDQLRKGGVSLMISTSRRTPKFAQAALRQKFATCENVWLWMNPEQDGDNPYLAFLHAASAVLVSSDSTNMLCDAASAAKPVLLFRLEGKDGKFANLYADLEQQNLLRPFDGKLEIWQSPAFDETKRAAKEVLRRFYNKRTI